MCACVCEELIRECKDDKEIDYQTKCEELDMLDPALKKYIFR